MAATDNRKQQPATSNQNRSDIHLLHSRCAPTDQIRYYNWIIDETPWWIATFAHCGCSEDGTYKGVLTVDNPDADPPGWEPLGPPDP
mmetsp:Transcript_14842/g.34376  ORF Transcript_14842/g.34376 Transcript_14842/m.34376 type:complete len:87 (-) Transcript_14842:365-625(-)